MWLKQIRKWGEYNVMGWSWGWNDTEARKELGFYSRCSGKPKKSLSDMECDFVFFLLFVFLKSALAAI